MHHARILLALSFLVAGAASPVMARVASRQTRHATNAEFSSAVRRGSGILHRVKLPEPIAEALKAKDAARLMRATMTAYALRDEQVARDLWTGLLLKLDRPETERSVVRDLSRTETHLAESAEWHARMRSGAELAEAQRTRRLALLGSVVECCRHDDSILDLIEDAVFERVHVSERVDHVGDAIPNTSRGALWRGFAIASRGDDIGALQAFRRAARDPVLAARAHFAAGRSLVRLRRFAEAVSELELAHDADGTAVAWDGADTTDELEDATSWLALALLRAGRAREAREALERKQGGADGSAGSGLEYDSEILGEALFLEGQQEPERLSDARVNAALRALRVERDAFKAATLGGFGWTTVGAEVSAALGRRDLALQTLDTIDNACRQPLRWEPDCARLQETSEKLGWTAPPLLPSSPDRATRPSDTELIPFAHSAVPRRWRTPMLERQSDEPGIEPPPALEGWRVIRLGRDGNDVVAISMQHWDVGGLPWGYWVHVSHDAGETFEAPLYLGMTPRWVVVRPTSAIPLVQAGVLNLEVLLREPVDDEMHSLEPVTRNPADARWIRVPLEELRRDSDGDSLTDLFEKRLYLDPDSADTDRDGLPDAVDPSPRAATVEFFSPAGAFVDLMLDRERGRSDYRSKHSITIPMRAGHGPPVPAPVALGAELSMMASVAFVTGDGVAELAPPPGERWIVLTPEEARAHETDDERPINLEATVIFDPAREHALVEVERNGCDTSAVATREGDDWALTGYFMWICSLRTISSPEKVADLDPALAATRAQIIATVTTPSEVKAIPPCLGLPARPPPLAVAREREQGELDFDG